MSRGPGRIQQEIAALIAANPDGAWTTTVLCQHIYGLVEKKHRVAVIRAFEHMEWPPLWKVCVLGRQGGELCLYNTGDVTSTMRKQRFNRGWADRKRATQDVRWERAYHKASPVEKIKIRLGLCRALGDHAMIAELEAELSDLAIDAELAQAVAAALKAS
jgi:hypothetical protein